MFGEMLYNSWEMFTGELIFLSSSVVQYLSVILIHDHLCFADRKSKDDTWVSNNTYWELRRDPGFSKMDFPVLW